MANENDNKTIVWECIRVKVADLKENPHNPKIKNDRGRARLHKSLSQFGLAGTIVCNKDLMIIDGHSRKKELVEKNIEEVWVSVPDRLLSKKDYDTFNAIFDLAVAGTTDLLFVEKQFTEEFFTEWDIDKALNPATLTETFTLPSGEKAPFQQMTFTLADMQAGAIKRAIKAVGVDDGNNHGNENRNGNALHQIIVEWEEQRKSL